MTLKYGLSCDPRHTGEHGQRVLNKVMAERYDIAERIMNSVRVVYGCAKKVSSREFIGARNRFALKRCENQKTLPTLDYRIHVVQIGDIAFASNPFELYQDFKHRMQTRSPFIQTFVIELAGTEGGNYLATKRAVESKGYSASMFCNMVSADGGQQWVENTLAILKDMKAQDET